MKRSSNWDEKMIESQLKKMPKIEDKQSKEALFERIHERLQEDEVKVRKKKSWFIPAVASAAVLFLLLLLVPSFLNETEFATDVPEMEDDANLMMEINDHPEEEADVARTEEAPGIQTTEEVNIGYYLSAAQPVDELEFSGELVTLAVVAFYPKGESVIPVTVLSEGENVLDSFMIAKDKFSGDAWGIGSFPNIEINSVTEGEEGVVVIDVPRNSLENLASAESTAYSLALQETFSKLGYDQIQFTSDGEQGVFWGQHGMLQTMELQGPRRGYYVFHTDTGHQFLVNGRTVSDPLINANFDDLSLEEVLQLMQQGGENSAYSASIPTDVVITNVEKEGDIVTVTIDENSIDSYREEYLIMVEAIMFAARDFDMNYVQFKGLDQLYQVGPYVMNEQVEIPKYMNFIR